ncbi:MAG: hypothetical protein JNJ73_13675 [Hyphomonadaceae bacterium]|nr:hypothetical protein [Hyphomonadaceae bacterium]
MIDDERLMAFADGMLDADEHRRIEVALAADPVLAAKVARMKRVAADLRGAFAGQLDLEVPPRLQALVAPKPAGNVVRFPARMRRQAWLGLAAAACLGLAFVAGRATSPELMRTDPTRGLIARGALQQALDARPSGGGASGGVAIALSFADQAGGHCRVFELEANAGLACGERGDWRIVALTEAAPSRAGEVVQAAGAIPDAILHAADERRAGDPLDAAGERAAIAARWRKGP